MLKTVEAVLERDGHLRLLEKIQLSGAKRVLVTFLVDEPDTMEATETALLSEGALGEDWERPEEEKAWEHLQ
jgi:hypothetical protein